MLGRYKKGGMARVLAAAPQQSPSVFSYAPQPPRPRGAVAHKGRWNNSTEARRPSFSLLRFRLDLLHARARKAPPTWGRGIPLGVPVVLLYPPLPPPSSPPPTSSAPAAALAPTTTSSPSSTSSRELRFGPLLGQVVAHRLPRRRAPRAHSHSRVRAYPACHVPPVFCTVSPSVHGEP